MKNLKQSQIDRALRLMPGGIPRYIRCYDNSGKSFDRFTVVFTGHYRKATDDYLYLAMSERPTHPQGFGQHGETQGQPVDRPAYAHLGQKIDFNHLPEDCRQVVAREYRELWGIDSPAYDAYLKNQLV